MTREPFEQEPTILEMIREGMEVYDHDGQQIGTVEQVYFGATAGRTADQGRDAATAANPDVSRDESLVEEFAEIFAAPSKLPEVLRNQLLRRGFIRVDASGLFANDRYVMPNQIAGVSGDRVMLRVSRDELIED
ncbi:MAG: hypothetical protein KatS3mg057_0198 [Herpetosiphonaceae bacterium]|nr:MAG: hypothetical protein KatS3mg057_0198 [Herpetosiphonaceae bacterium]